MEPAFKKPRIFSRADWRARPRKGKPAKHEPSRIVLHHSWRPTMEQFLGAKTIRAIQNYHMDASKFSDIGYHFIVGPDGSIWEGRPVDEVGAHCGNNPGKKQRRQFGNTGSIGICCIGNFDTEQPTEDQVYWLAQLIVWLQRQHGIHHKDLYGHRECVWPPLKKTCPGQNLYACMIGRDRWQDIEKALL